MGFPPRGGSYKATTTVHSIVDDGDSLLGGNYKPTTTVHPITPMMETPYLEAAKQITLTQHPSTRPVDGKSPLGGDNNYP